MTKFEDKFWDFLKGDKIFKVFLFSSVWFGAIKDPRNPVKVESNVMYSISEMWLSCHQVVIAPKEMEKGWFRSERSAINLISKLMMLSRVPRGSFHIHSLLSQVEIRA